MKNREKIYSGVVVLLLFDQIAKLLVRSNMEFFQEITVIPHFFSLYYVQNTGAAFSILRGGTIFLVFLSLLFLVLLDRYLKKTSSFTSLEMISFSLIMGGIYGNLIDRILYHAVVDYLSFTIFSYSFPVFNIADIGITIGVFLYFISMFILKRGDKDEGDFIRDIRRGKRRKSKN